jgi:hypothetical protein
VMISEAMHYPSRCTRTICPNAECPSSPKGATSTFPNAESGPEMIAG